MLVKTVESHVYPLKDILNAKYTVDYFQREYVWSRKQLEDLISDLSMEFLRQWKPNHVLLDAKSYNPYYMGEIVLSTTDNITYSIIDGQQRITSLTLLLIYLVRNYNTLPNFPDDFNRLIYSKDYGEYEFNLAIPERKKCMLGLYENGAYMANADDSISVKNILERYSDIKEVWNQDINNDNVVAFAYWLKDKVCFSKVWTNNDDFAYVIFETMNDRGISLTQVEMLRSYLLANIDNDIYARNEAMTKFDKLIKDLLGIKLSSKSKAEYEFFKILFRTHFAKDVAKGNSDSDFVRIGKEFHRWFRDNSQKIGLKDSSDFAEFVNKLTYFAKIYCKILNLISSRNSTEYLYLIVNNDYGFTLQPALILSSVKYKDDDATVEQKIKIVSKYLSKVLSWRVWNQNIISQSALEADIYKLALEIRDKDVQTLKAFLDKDPIHLPDLDNTPILNQQNRSKLRVLLALITEIVAVGSNEAHYILNDDNIEVEHIWSNKFNEHLDEFSDEGQFASRRNTIGDLLLLPKSFNASYGDMQYKNKVKKYIEQNILAQSLNDGKYKNNPGFIDFKNQSKLKFKAYADFKNYSITERTNLYREILKWNWR